MCLLSLGNLTGQEFRLSLFRLVPAPSLLAPCLRVVLTRIAVLHGWLRR